MNGILYTLAFVILGICILSALAFLWYTDKYRKNIKASCSKIDDAQSTLSNLDTIIETSVVSINQKMVSHLKENNSFMQSDKEEAFNECRKMVYQMAAPKALETLSCLGMDTEGWINARIEYFVRKHKSKN